MLAGGGFWPPLAVVIVGGVAGATLLALYFVPAAHLMLARRARRKLPAASRRENRPSEVDLVAAEHLQGVFLKGLTAQGSLGEASVLKETK